MLNQKVQLQMKDSHIPSLGRHQNLSAGHQAPWAAPAEWSCLLHQGGKGSFLTEYPEFRKPRPRNAPSHASRAVKCCKKLLLPILLFPATCQQCSTDLHNLHFSLYRHESFSYTLRCWEAQGSGLTQEIQEH